MKVILAILACLLMVSAFADNSAQTDTVRELKFINDLVSESADSLGKGSVSISGDARINELVWKHVKMSEYEGGVEGWRIQIYNSSGREAREEANEIRTKFLNKYPEMKAYLIYQPPYFKIRIGDYRTKQEAYGMYKDVVRHFPVSYLVPDKINFPELEEPENIRKKKR